MEVATARHPAFQAGMPKCIREPFSSERPAGQRSISNGSKGDGEHSHLPLSTRNIKEITKKFSSENTYSAFRESFSRCRFSRFGKTCRPVGTLRHFGKRKDSSNLNIWERHLIYMLGMENRVGFPASLDGGLLAGKWMALWLLSVSFPGTVSSF